MTGGDDRNRSTSRPSTRGSREAPALSSSMGSASLSKRSGSVRSTTSSANQPPAVLQGMGPLSIDTQSAIKQTGARAESGTPTSAPVLGSNSTTAIAGAPSLSTELLHDPVESGSLSRSAFGAASQPSSPLSASDGFQPFAFDRLGRRRQPVMGLDSVDLDNDDVDLDLELSDDDISDDLHDVGAGGRGPLLVNSGRGWTVRNDDDIEEGIEDDGAAYLPEAFVHNARKGSSGSDSSNDILTPSVEGGYNVYKPPYQHLLSPEDASALPGGSGFTAATDLSSSHSDKALSKEPSPIHVDLETAAPSCQTFAMDESLSNQAAALRKGEMTEHVSADGTASVDESTPASSSSVSRSTSHRQAGSGETSRATSAADTQTTRSDTDDTPLDRAEGKQAEAQTTAEPVVNVPSTVTEESQFADADEDATAAEMSLGSSASKLGPTSTALLEEDEDSDEQAISFQARRKTSTRFRATPASAS